MDTIDRRYDAFRCGLKVDTDAIRANLKGMKALAKGKLVCAVVKADAYGHGAIRTARAIDDITDVFAVATIDEGLSLKNEARIRKPVLILGPVFEACDEVAVANDLTQTLFDPDRARALSVLASSLGRDVKARVHIAVDTGMSRIGLKADQSGLKLLEEICLLPNISVDGIFTHFATADAIDKQGVKAAYHKFLDFKQKCLEKGIRIPIWHAANSACVIDGIALDDEMDMVRCGISMYGIYPSKEVHRENLKLKYPMEWYSFVTRTALIKAGTGVSYGYSFTADRDMHIATVCCGYADGYPRLLSNQGEVLVHGKRCRIVGRICMDQFMIDIEDVPQTRPGDRVILMGSDHDETITPDELAEKCGTIAYEIVCGISKRVPRI